MDLAPTAETDSYEAGEHPKGSGQFLMIFVIGLLYFAQGIPIGFTFYAFPAILRSQGSSLELLAWVPLIGLPWALKFLWAPIVDNNWISSLGRRKSWLVFMQAFMVIAMAGIALTISSPDLLIVALTFLFIASLVSATQDIATDGLAAERLKGGALVGASSLSIGGMMAGMLVGGAATLLLTKSFGLDETIWVLTGILLFCALPVLIWREPPVITDASMKNTKPSKERASLLKGLKREHFISLFIVTSIYAVVHTTENTLVKFYLIDQGWQLDKIGVLTTISSLSLIAIGCSFASWLVMKIGAWISALFGLLINVSSLFIWIAISKRLIAPTLLYTGFVSALAGAGFGLTAVAIFTIVMRYSSSANQTGTDVTLFKSGNFIGEILAASLATLLAAKLGYAMAFSSGIIVAILTMTIILYTRKKTKKLNLS